MKDRRKRAAKAKTEAVRRAGRGWGREAGFQVEGARVGEIASPLRGLRVSGRQGPWREGSLYFKLKGNSKYRPLSQSPCASRSFSQFPVLHSLSAAFVPFYLFSASQAYTLSSSTTNPLRHLLVGVFKLFKLKLFSISKRVLSKERKGEN